jgi:asparagine synthase (glutamine-hydrolysing)
MCGIAGFSLKGPPPEGLLEAMTSTLAHRGPDGEGYFREGGVGLGHRRLSIIDVEGGAQPLFNEDRTVAVIYNGEIYNFAELRQGLLSRGHRLATRSDTEVLVHLYEEEGDSFLPRLDGIFAFALLDRRRGRLLLARDPVGVKPLYYAVTPQGLLFGSELKALAVCPMVDRTMDWDALRAYLTLEYVPSPLSIYRDAKKLPPGHLAIWEDGRLAVRRYWDWSIPEALPAGRDECRELLRERIRRSVKSQLVSDVPLGVFLSGGVDSAVVAASMAAAGGEVLSFSIGFDDPSFDESVPARTAATHLGTSHHERPFGEAALIAEVPRILAHSDEPHADPSILPTALLSRFARERVTVALGGDGGDELFAGYPTYFIHRKYGLYCVLPGPLRRGLLSAADRFLPVSHANLTLPYKLRKFRDGAEEPMPDRHFFWMGAFNREAKRELIGARAEGSEPWGLDWVPPSPSREPATTAQWLDFHTYLAEGVLAKVDRASMMASLEARVPLLAPSLVRLAFSLPPDWKLTGTRGKAILKDSFSKDLPPCHFERPKKGFGIPVARWLCGPLKEWAGDLLSPASLRCAPFLNTTVVGRMWREHQERRADHRKPLWTLLCFLSWVERWRPS